LVKPQFSELLNQNPNISKVITLHETVHDELEKENYSIVLDLQKNRKSVLLRKKIGVKSYSFKKLNIKKWLLVQTGINLLPEKHIVERYFEAISPLNVVPDSEGCEFYPDKSDLQSQYNLPVKYIVLAAGAAHIGKRFTAKQIVKICSDSQLPVILLGDKNDLNFTTNLNLDSRTKNLCGKTSIKDLGSIINLSSGVISGDTGIMHIASCFSVPQVSVWGCTRPVLGMWPYLKKNHISISANSNRPCSKLGNKCRNHPDFCMSQHNVNLILSKLELLIEK